MGRSKKGLMVREIAQAPPIPPRNYAIPSNFNFNTSEYGGAHGSPLCQNQNHLYESYDQKTNNIYNGNVQSIVYRQAPFGNTFKDAEESLRSTFTSMEQVINMFVSITNAVISTHQALFNMYKAVITAVGQFINLKDHVLTAIIITIFRWLRLIWRRLLVILRIRPMNYALTDATLIWNDSLRRNISMEESKGPSFDFTRLLFWIVLVGGPYLLLSSALNILKVSKRDERWFQGVGECYLAKALYDFTAGSENEISCTADDLLRIAPKSKQPRVNGWILASHLDGKRIGFVPINYITIVNKILSPNTTSTHLDNAHLDNDL